MNKLVKNILLLAGGITLSLLLLFLFSQLPGRGTDNQPVFETPHTDQVFISALSGSVYILRGSETLQALVGQSLMEGDILKVVDDAYCQVQFAQHGTATLNNNTLLRLQKFLNAQRDQDIRTEILMGSMLYRVNKGEEGRSFKVESEGVVYDVTGTEFLILRDGEGTRLSVTEGSVLIQSLKNLWSAVKTEAGREVFLSSGGQEAPQEQEISPRQQETMEELQGLSEISIVSGDEPVLIALRSDPPGADIYLEGLKVGQGHFEGLFQTGETLNFMIRKRGFQDGTLQVATAAGENRLYRVELQPLGLQDSLKKEWEYQSQQEEPEDQSEEIQALLDEYRKKEESQTRLLEEMEQRMTALESQRDNLKTTLDQQSEREENLETQLSDKENEITRLKSLIKQIQELADE